MNNINNKQIFISVGEYSGDIYGSQLALKLKENLNNNVDLFGVGFTNMKKCGVQLLNDVTPQAVMGITDVVKSIFKIYGNFKKCEEFLNNNKLDALILIDYAGFNLKLAQIAKKINIPVFYFIPPKVWAWGKSRINLINKYVDKVYSIFEFEHKLLSKNKVNSIFLGHPIFDIIKNNCSDYDEYIQKLKNDFDNVINKKNVVILMPGSRKSEVELILPTMLKSINELVKEKKFLKDNIEFVIPVALSIDENIIKKKIKGLKFNIKLIYSDKERYEYFKKSFFGLVTSGTATLELALFGIPMIILYKTSIITKLLANILINTKYIGLPNILSKTLIVPELTNNEVNVENILYYTFKLLAPDNYKANSFALLKCLDYLHYNPNASVINNIAIDIIKSIGGKI